MAMRKRQTKQSRGAKAPWRETRRVDGSLDGGSCTPGLAAECTSLILGSHFPFPFPNLPCQTILAYPVLFTPDWQPVSTVGAPSWKERVVHTFTRVDVEIVPNYLWLASVSKLYFDQMSTDNPTAILIAPWRSALVIYDDDEVLDAAGLESMFSDGWTETERYVPGSYRSGTLFHQGSVVDLATSAPRKISVNAKVKRRLETGEGLYWQFEMGCVTARGRRPGAGGEIDHEGMFAEFNSGPFWLLGQFHTSYVE